MARKVFISVLGTGIYKPCIYGDTGITTRFIQEATLLSIGAKEWSSNDTGIVLLTDFARTTNWVVPDNKRFDKVNNVEITDYCGLKQRIDALGLPFAVNDISIPDGENEEEMWTIFTTLFDQLKDGDELYIDLTHAFRYLPMLVLVLTNYAKFLLNGVTVKSMTYGNYEARVDGIAPMVDLLPIAALQDWTYAAADYLKNGYASRLKELTETTLTPLLRDESTRSRNLIRIRSFSTSIVQLSEERILCRGAGIINGKSISQLIKSANQIEKMTIAPLKPVMDKIIASVNDNGDTVIKRCINAARWCYGKQLYQQAITILQEGIVTFFCMRNGIDSENEDKRKLINTAFLIVNKNKKLASLDKNAADNIRIVADIIRDDFFFNQELIQLFSSITDLRNDYNHSGFRDSPSNAGTMTKNISQYIDDAESIFIDNSKE